jgi:hypothetical protein
MKVNKRSQKQNPHTLERRAGLNIGRNIIKVEGEHAGYFD